MHRKHYTMGHGLLFRFEANVETMCWVSCLYCFNTCQYKRSYISGAMAYYAKKTLSDLRVRQLAKLSCQMNKHVLYV